MIERCLNNLLFAYNKEHNHDNEPIKEIIMNLTTFLWIAFLIVLALFQFHMEYSIDRLFAEPAWDCSGDIYNCSDFDSCEIVMDYFNSCPGDVSRLDKDGDNLPCETLCK